MEAVYWKTLTNLTAKDLVGFYFSHKGLTKMLNALKFFSKVKKKDVFITVSLS